MLWWIWWLFDAYQYLWHTFIYIFRYSKPVRFLILCHLLANECDILFSRNLWFSLFFLLCRFYLKLWYYILFPVDSQFFVIYPPTNVVYHFQEIYGYHFFSRVVSTTLNLWYSILFALQLLAIVFKYGCNELLSLIKLTDSWKNFHVFIESC